VREGRPAPARSVRGRHRRRASCPPSGDYRISARREVVNEEVEVELEPRRQASSPVWVRVREGRGGGRRGRQR
jgi:hypothetical protein